MITPIEVRSGETEAAPGNATPAKAIPPTYAAAGSRRWQATGASLRLSLLGPVTLSLNGREFRIKSLKLRAMLGYLALHEFGCETRERLVGLLWSESGEVQARAVLRQVIRELRGLFAETGYEGLQIAAREIGLEPGSIGIDIWDIIGAAEAGRVHPLLFERRYLIDELLAGLDDLDPVFRMWVIAKRHTVRDWLLRNLEAALSDDSADAQQRIHVAQGILNLDPTHEEACRSLMRARAIGGDTAAALRAYKELWDLLDEEHGMEPSPATQQLVAEIKTGAFEQPALPTITLSTRPPAIGQAAKPAGVPQQQARLWLAVQEVPTTAVTPDKVHLVVAFRQILIASLVRFREWQVTDAPLTDAAGPPSGSTGGRYEVQMAAHQVADAVHLTITLKEIETSLYVWSESFELRLENWFDSQRHIVRRIAMALNVHVSADRLRRFSNEPDVSLGLYDRWLRCQTLVRTFSPQHWQNLVQQFTEIINEAENFVPAYCGLVDLHNTEHIVHPGVFRSREREAKALEYARRAVQLDPIDMRAHNRMAWAHVMAKQYDLAMMHLDVACELNPNDTWMAISGALILAFCGETQRALELARLAMDLTLAPSRTHWAYHTDIQFLAGNYESAIVAADHAQNVLWGVSAWRASALAHLGRTEEAAEHAATFIATARSNWYGAEPATDESVTRWLLHMYPIRRREDWERFRDGLILAGLPCGEAKHHEW